MENRFYCVHDWMTKELGLRGNELLVFAAIHGFSESCGEFSGSLSYLAERTGTAKSTLSVSLRRLTEKGLLRKRELIKNSVKYCAYTSCRADRSGPRRPVPETERGVFRNPDSPIPESGWGYTGTRTGAYRNPDGGIPESGHNIKEDNKDDIKKDNKACEKPARPIRHKYGEYENVLLSDEEAGKLKNEFPDDWKQRVERLSEYMASTGKQYRNHLATIRAWARMDAPKPEKKGLFADLKGVREL